MLVLPQVDVATLRISTKICKGVKREQEALGASVISPEAYLLPTQPQPRATKADLRWPDATTKQQRWRCQRTEPDPEQPFEKTS